MSIPARRTGELIAAVIEDVRKWANDRSTDPQGNVITALRFTTADVTDAINFQIADMASDAGIESIGENLAYTDFTYTEDSGDGMDLPSAVPPDAPVFAIEKLGGNIPERLRQVGPTEVEDFALGLDDATTARADVWSISAAVTGYGQRLRIRPSAGHSLRVWYVANPFQMIDDATNTAVPFTARFREYIAVGAAARLLEPSGDISDQHQIRLQRCEAQFQRFCSRMRANDSIRMEFPNV